MIDFKLIDDSEELNLQLLDDNEEIKLEMTDYDDTEVKEMINEVDNKVDNLSVQVNQEINEIETDIDELDGRITVNTNNISNLQQTKADKTQVNSLSTQVQSNTIQIGQNKADITALDNRVDQIPIVTKTSQLTNDSGFITKNVNNLTYYTTTANLARVALTGNYNDLTNKPDLSSFATTTELGNETTARENADIGLQGQIDAITSSSDVKDIVGTYTELQNYDTSTLGNDDIIKVLQDSTHNEAMTYYRWVISGSSGSWQYIGQEGPYYTKSESDTLLNAKQNEITSSNKLSSDLVSDTNQTNKFVTASDITNWNGKQNALTPGDNINISGTTISATDTTYSDATQTTAGLMSSTDKTKLDGIQTGATKNLIYIGTCSTGASTRLKVVECQGFILEEGATISVTFTNAQTYNGSPQLNVNGTGAIIVQSRAGTNGVRYLWSAGEIIDFTYDGTYWVCHGRGFATTSYYGVTKLSTSASSDSQALALTPRSLYYLANYSICPYYSASKTYAVGDKVRYTYYIYECITAIDEPESWNVEHWQQIDTIQEQIDLKQETLVSGTNIKTINNESLLGSGNITIQGGTIDYSDLANKPSINNITLSGNKSLSDLGIQPSGSYATTTDLATKQDITDNNLTTTNKTIPGAINEVNSIAKGANQAVGYSNYSSMITAINAMDDEEFSMGQNIYVVTVEVPDLWVSGVESTSSTYTYVDDATVINDLETNGYIQVGYYKLSMLETQKVDLTNYVTNTDYATSSVGGVVRVYNSDGFAMNNGVLIGAVKTNQQYEAAGNWMMVCKGTLENVIAGKGLGTYSKPSGGIPSTDLDSTVQTSLGKADDSVQLNGGSAVQTISLTSGTGTTALGLKSMSTSSSYVSFSNPNGWLGSYGVSSLKKPVFYNGIGYTLATTDDIPKVVTLSQADYDDLISGGTVDADTYYFIEE